MFSFILVIGGRLVHSWNVKHAGHNSVGDNERKDELLCEKPVHDVPQQLIQL